jgi:hypothetical protein
VDIVVVIVVVSGVTCSRYTRSTGTVVFVFVHQDDCQAMSGHMVGVRFRPRFPDALDATLLTFSSKCPRRS